MRNLVFAAIAALCIALPVAAQTTQVSGTITTNTCLGTGTMQAQESGCILIVLPSTTGSVGLEVGNGWTGTLVAEGFTANGGWVPRIVYASGVPIAAILTPGLYVIDPGGAAKVRVRPLTLDSGSLPILLLSLNVPPNPTVIGVTGADPTGAQRPIAVSPQGVTYVLQAGPPLNPFLPRCNAVRTTQCQP